MDEQTGSRLSQADWIVVVAIAAGGLGGCFGLVLWQVADLYFPPIAISFGFALAAAALVYRFLDGAKGSLFNLGPMKLAGASATFMAVIWFMNAQLVRQMDIADSPAKLLIERNKNRTLEAELENEKALAAKLSESVKRLNSEQGLGTIEKIRQLSPADDFSKQLVQMAKKREGPWSPTAKEDEVTVSVVGYLKGRRAAACENLHFGGEKVQLVSLLMEDGENIRSEDPVIPDSWERISSTFCGAGRTFDVQVGCALATELFTKRVLTCDSSGGPAWNRGFKNLIKAGASTMVNQE